MLIVPREAWGARPPRFRNTIATPTPELFLHHLASEWHGVEGMRDCQDFHMDSRGWSDIAYSFLVDDLDQTVYEGRGAGVAGGHTEDHNQISHAICVMGNFDTRAPAEATLHTVAALVRHGREQGWWHDLTGGHRDVNSTACPGQYLYPLIPEIRLLADQGDTFMPLTPEDVAAIADEVMRRLNVEGAGVGTLGFGATVQRIDTAAATILNEDRQHAADIYAKLDELLARPGGTSGTLHVTGDLTVS